MPRGAHVLVFFKHILIGAALRISNESIPPFFA
jgi:hypothetical protein